MRLCLRPAVSLLVLLTLLTGGAYPLLVTVMAQMLFPKQASGSMIVLDGQVAGSALVGQANHDSRYFWPRPSASDYGTLPSGAFNAGPTSASLAAAVAERTAALRRAYGLAENAALPADLLLASGSGLDPHISPEAARLQVGRIAAARGLSKIGREQVARLVEQMVEPPQFGIFGQPRVNVLLLNLALDRLAAALGDRAQAHGRAAT